MEQIDDYGDNAADNYNPAIELPNNYIHKQVKLREAFTKLKQKVDHIDKELKKDKNMDIESLVLTTHDSFHKAIKKIY